MKKLITTFLLMCQAGFLFAQFDFQATQSFYRKPVELPKIGFDCIRAQYQQITEQQPQVGMPGSWTDANRYITRRGTGFYTEIGTYYYDTVQGSWVVNVSDVYSNFFNASTHNLDTSSWNHRYADSSNNTSWRVRTFFHFARPDSQVLERAVVSRGTVFMLQSAKKFLYAADDRILRIRTYYAAKEVFTDTFFYDAQNRVVRHLSLDQKPGGSNDSSAQDFYMYDSVGHIVQYRNQLYAGSGWLTLRETAYTYDLLGNLVYAGSSYYNSQTQSMNLSFEFYCTHDISGKINTYREVVYGAAGDTTDRLIRFRYDFAHNPIYAMGYLWAGNDYDTIPVVRYLFEEPVLTSVNKTSEQGRLRIYPNPVKDMIHFSSPVRGNISVCDLTGRHVKDVSVPEPISGLAVEELQPGCYIILVEGTGAARFLKE